MKLDINKVDLTDNNQKILAFLFVIATGALLAWVLPSVVAALELIWSCIILGIPLILIIIKRQEIWNLYKFYSWELTKGLIGSNKLGYMWRYYDYVISQLAKLGENIKSVGAAKESIKKAIEKLEKDIERDKKLAIEAQKQGKSNLIINTIANRVAVSTDQLSALLPRYESIVNQEKSLIELEQNWDANAKDLKFSLEAKEELYETLFVVNEATKNSEEFLDSNSNQKKMFKESLKQLENEMSSFTSNIADFERRAQPVIENMNIARSANEEAGLAMIEDYKKKLNL